MKSISHTYCICRGRIQTTHKKTADTDYLFGGGPGRGGGGNFEIYFLTYTFFFFCNLESLTFLSVGQDSNFSSSRPVTHMYKITFRGSAVALRSFLEDVWGFSFTYFSILTIFNCTRLSSINYAHRLCNYHHYFQKFCITWAPFDLELCGMRSVKGLLSLLRGQSVTQGSRAVPSGLDDDHQL